VPRPRLTPDRNELLDPAFELFMLLLSLLSIVNLFIAWIVPVLDPDARNVLRITDSFLSVFFLFDFTRRFFHAEPHRHYLVRGWGWADLISAAPVPGLRIFRISRIWRSGVLMRRIGARDLILRSVDNRASAALYIAVFLVIFVLEVAGVSVLYAERNAPNANIVTGSDAIWWGYVTITTVGYGDRYPVTNNGRLVGIALLTAGVGLFAVLTGFLANAFLAPHRRPRGSLAEEAEPRQRLARVREDIEAQEKVLADLKAQIRDIENSL
jgi:voltage-gated potassium channel